MGVKEKATEEQREENVAVTTGEAPPAPHPPEQEPRGASRELQTREKRSQRRKPR